MGKTTIAQVNTHMAYAFSGAEKYQVALLQFGTAEADRGVVLGPGGTG